MFQINDINKEISKKLSIDIKTVERINEIYYRDVVEALNIYKASEIKLVYLATLKARFSPVKRRIWGLIKVIRNLRKKPVVSEIEIKNRTDELRALWKIKNEFAIKTYNKIQNGRQRKN